MPEFDIVDLTSGGREVTQESAEFTRMQLDQVATEYAGVLSPAELEAIRVTRHLLARLAEHEIGEEAAPGPLAQLYAAVKDIQAPDGGLNGGDVVDIVTELLVRHGFDLSGPADDDDGMGYSGAI